VTHPGPVARPTQDPSRRRRLPEWLSDGAGPVWVAMAVCCTALAVARGLSRDAVSWHSFVQGTHVLFSESALHLFSAHRVLQIGPVTYLVISPAVWVVHGAGGRVVAMMLVAAAGVVLLGQVRALAPAADRAAARRFALAAAPVCVVWTQLAVTYTHPDDALALLFGVVATRLTASGRPVAAALAIGLAADCKPWALAFAALLVAGQRRRLATLTCGVTVAVAWLPFALGDPHSTAAATFRIANVASSSLRVLGVASPTTPPWDRPAQIALGIGLGLLAVRRGRWPAVLLLAVCARLLLDPGTKTYYDAGLLAGSAVADVMLTAGTVPVLTLSALLLFTAPRSIDAVAPHVYGVVRTVYLLGAIGAVLWWPAWAARGGPDQPVMSALVNRAQARLKNTAA
jgi:hypothetical protein